MNFKLYDNFTFDDHYDLAPLQKSITFMNLDDARNSIGRWGLLRTPRGVPLHHPIVTRV